MGNYYSTSTDTTISNNCEKNEISTECTNQTLLIQEQSRKYGWVRDIPDQRDKHLEFYNIINKYKTPITTLIGVDLRDNCPPVYDQGTLGSCTANAISAAFHYDELKQNNNDEFMPSRLFIYFNERKKEGTINSDRGASIRDGIKSINKVGVCHETLWPYDETKFMVEPSNDCYLDAIKHKSLTYHRIKQTREQLKSALLEGFPIICGITIYESFNCDNVKKTGEVPMPSINDKICGGHAILLVGYNDLKNKWIFRNSWGVNWGDNGYGYIPIEYLDSDKNLSADFWVIKSVDN